MKSLILAGVLLASTAHAQEKPMRILIETIPHAEQRYPTCGDYVDEPDGTLHIRVSEMGDRRYEFLVALHELVEAELVRFANFPLKAIDDFDMNFDGDGEPGDDPRAPYYWEHQFATGIERRMATKLDVDWKAYNDAVDALGD